MTNAEGSASFREDGNSKTGKEQGKSPFGPVGIKGNPDVHYTPWLVVRYAPGDVGDRPLPASTVFWESPDVWVTGPGGFNQPVPGVANKVFARVTNYGLQQANGVVVKFWWADPSLAITESTAHPIGVGFADIPSLRSQVVECPQPWVPIEENGGHECLIAEAYVPITDPLTTPMDPVADRHVGQKNEHLVTVEPGQPFHVRIGVLNVSPMAQDVGVLVYPVLLDRVPALITSRFPHNTEISAPSVAQVPLSLHVESGSSFVPTSTLFARRLLQATEPAAAPAGTFSTSLPQISHSLHFESWESRTLELSGVVPANAEVGQTFLFRIVQQLGPVTTGGYTVAVLVGAEAGRAGTTEAPAKG
jgi:hypothetical protein